MILKVSRGRDLGMDTDNGPRVGGEKQITWVENKLRGCSASV